MSASLDLRHNMIGTLIDMEECIQKLKKQIDEKAETISDVAEELEQLGESFEIMVEEYEGGADLAIT